MEFIMSGRRWERAMRVKMTWTNHMHIWSNKNIITFLKIFLKKEAGEKAQQSRMFAALVKNPGSLLSTHRAVYNCPKFQLHRSSILSDLWVSGMHVLHMQTWVQNPHTYKINKSQQANEQKGNGRYLIVHCRRCAILKTLCKPQNCNSRPLFCFAHSYYCVHVCACRCLMGGCTCHCTCEEARQQLVECSLFTFVWTQVTRLTLLSLLIDPKSHSLIHS